MRIEPASELLVRRIIEWIDRMASTHGGVVCGHGRQWDWGQALCVEQYGLDFAAWPENPTRADVERAMRWEAGEWPEWVADKPPLPVPVVSAATHVECQGPGGPRPAPVGADGGA